MGARIGPNNNWFVFLQLNVINTLDIIAINNGLINTAY